jgi:hypothetical protein
MSVSGITGNSVGTASAELRAASPRRWVRISNQHATATVAINFGSAAALNSTNGSITLSGFNSGNNTIEFSHPPDSAINAIASGASTPVTVEEW